MMRIITVDENLVAVRCKDGRNRENEGSKDLFSMNFHINRVEKLGDIVSCYFKEVT
jgi:hypothetical protein